MTTNLSNLLNNLENGAKLIVKGDPIIQIGSTFIDMVIQNVIIDQ